MNQFLSTVGVILGVLVVLAGAIGTWAAFRVGRNAQTVSNYRDALQSWKERSESVEAKSKEQDNEIHELQTRVNTLESEKAELAGQVKVLRDAISGRQSFDSIVSTLGVQHREILEAFSKQHIELIGRLDKLAGGR